MSVNVSKKKFVADPDVELMLRVREDDRAAFNQLVIRHQPRVLQQLIGMVWHRQDAEDLTQNVFMRVFVHRKTYQPQARFTTWLYTIVLNVGRNARRSYSRHAGRFCQIPDCDVDAFCDPRQTTPLETLERHECYSQLGWGLNLVPNRQRTALRLYYLDGCSKLLIADRLNTTLSAVDGLLRRGRQQLRSRLCQN